MDTNDVASETEVVTVKVPYGSRNATQCLPCDVEEYFKEMTAVQQIQEKIKGYRREMGSEGLVHAEFFDLL